MTFFVDSGLNHGWNDSFWRGIGLGDLVDEGYSRIGTRIQEPGLPVGCGLKAGAAKELGLPEGTPVATSIIDAHAGGIGKGSSHSNVRIVLHRVRLSTGTVGADLSAVSDLSNCSISSRLAIIAGTSTCHMAVSRSC